jgi:hypothetical protein
MQLLLTLVSEQINKAMVKSLASVLKQVERLVKYAEATAELLLRSISIKATRL